MPRVPTVAAARPRARGVFFEDRSRWRAGRSGALATRPVQR